MVWSLLALIILLVLLPKVSAEKVFHLLNSHSSSVTPTITYEALVHNFWRKMLSKIFEPECQL